MTQPSDGDGMRRFVEELRSTQYVPFDCSSVEMELDALFASAWLAVQPLSSRI